MKNYLFLNNEYFDLTIYQYGCEKCQPFHTFGPGMRSHYLIHCVLSGKGTCCASFGGRDFSWQLHEGQAFLIEPGKLVHYFADGQDPWEYMWIEFDGMKAKEYLSQAGLSQASPIYHPVSSQGREECFGYLRQMLDNPNLLPCQVIGLAYLFFGALIQSSRDGRKPVKNSIQDFYIQSTVDFVENHYMEEISVEDMAANLNLNRTYFSKLFKKLTTKSPQDFLIQYRMNKACQLLRSTDFPISQVAQMVGYHNPFHFTRAFKSVFQIPPQQWRKSQKKEGAHQLTPKA